MPTPKRNIRLLLARIERDPQLVHDLLFKAGNENQRKDILVRRGLLKRGDVPTREEIKAEIETLLSVEHPPYPDDLGARPVEWVGAIATAAAGAAAAACTGD